MVNLKQLLIVVVLALWAVQGLASTLAPAVFSYDYQILRGVEGNLTGSDSIPNFQGPQIVEDGTSEARSISSLTIQGAGRPQPSVRITAIGEARTEAGIVGGTGFVATEARATVEYQFELRKRVPGAPDFAEVDLDFIAWVDLLSPEFEAPAADPDTLGALQGFFQIEAFGVSYVYSKRVGSSRGCAGVARCEVTSSFLINTLDEGATRTGPYGQTVPNSVASAGLPGPVFLIADDPQTISIRIEVDLDSGAVEDGYEVDAFLDPLFTLTDPRLADQLEIVVSANVGNGESASPPLLFNDGFEP